MDSGNLYVHPGRIRDLTQGLLVCLPKCKSLVADIRRA
jgi:hypothetical protein